MTPGAHQTQALPLSPTTKDLLERLDTVATCLADPAATQSENDLMAQHVRSVLNSDNEPVFTEEVLKLAYVELVHTTVSQHSATQPATPAASRARRRQ